MRHARRMRPEQLMNPDLVSEIVLVGSFLVIVFSLLFTLLKALSQA
jgi:hypothetical protein